jgi:hypothetical protein
MLKYIYMSKEGNKKDYLGSESVNPDYSTLKGASSVDRNHDAPARPSTARQLSKELEQNAAQKPHSHADDISGAKSAEQDQPGGLYTGKGLPTTQKEKGKRKGFFRGKGALFFIFTMILGGGGIMLGSQSMLAPHLEAMFTSATDTQYTSYSLRNARLFRFMVDGGDQIVTRWNGSKKFTTFTPYMQSRLARNGINIGHIGDTGEFVSGDFLAGKRRVLQYRGEVIDADSFMTRFQTDTNFRDDYYKAKRGRVAGFFDDAVEWVYRKLGLSRNIFDNHKNTGNTNTDEVNFKNTVSEQVDGTNTDTGTRQQATTTNENGETQTQTEDNTARTRETAAGTEAPETKARNYLSTMSKVSAGLNIVCAAMRVGNMISVAVAANEIYQSINYFMGLMENISKMKAGHGDTSAVNDVLNFLTRSETTTTTLPEANDWNNSDTSTARTITQTGSPLEAEGPKLILGGITPNRYRAGAYSLERVSRTTMSAIAMNAGTMGACQVARGVGAVISLSANALPGGGVVRAVVGILINTVGGVAIQLGVSAILGALVPSIAQTFFTDIFTRATGIPGGELFAKGASAANSRAHRTASGGSPSDETSINQFSRATNTAIAMEAELDRLNRSPFDISSPHTFLGSIAANFTLLLSRPSFLTPFFKLTNVANRSFSRIAGADGAGQSYITTYGDCPNLEAIGAKGDIYCNPIVTTDLSTIDAVPDPDSTYMRVITPSVYHLDSEGNVVTGFDEDGNANIKNGSDLANYITFCADRDSPFGVVDANILTQMQTNGGAILNNMPFVGNVLDFVNAVEDSVNMPWATGERCVNSPNNPYWETFKYYQRYIEDTRILDQMGAYGDGNSPVIAFLNKHYQENPLDNSPAGYLARITGMTKDQVSFMLDFMQYSEFIATYNPTHLFPLPYSSSETPLSDRLPDITIARHSTAPFAQHIIYTDIRNRSFAI